VEANHTLPEVTGSRKRYNNDVGGGSESMYVFKAD